MERKLITLMCIGAFLASGLMAQNTCGWTEDAAKTDKENLLDLLQCLAEGENHWLLKKHFVSIKMIMEKPDAGYTDEYLTMVSEVYTFIQGDGQLLSTYVDNEVRPLIMAFTSPADSEVSYYKLTLPENWVEDSTNYPMYIELHGYGGGKNDNPLRQCLRTLQTTPLAGTAAQLRRDGYHLYPWGRGDKFYKGIAETDIWECLEDFDGMFETNPERQYMYGYSMGGGGTWNLAYQKARRWAGIGCYSPYLPDGIPTFDIAKIYAGISVWVAWGSEETWAKENGSAMVEMLTDFGAVVEWFEVKNVGHSYLGNYQEKMLDFFSLHPKVYDGPTIHGIADVVLPLPIVSEPFNINLSGISNEQGDTDGVQIEVQTNNSELITGLYITEVLQDGTATILFTPGAGTFGTAEIVIMLSDDSGYTTSKTILVHAKNYTIDQVEDQTVENLMRGQEIPITGIGDGTDAVSHLTVSAVTDRPDLVIGLQIGEISPEGIATLRYQPSKIEQGTAKIT
ncbi:MAG: hypothetical protein KAT15_00670, partial [Bacteroidales bacterium]|nr:hypothetical protein [Bacteroidales bacterium]